MGDAQGSGRLLDQGFARAMRPATGTSRATSRPLLVTPSSSPASTRARYRDACCRSSRTPISSTRMVAHSVLHKWLPCCSREQQGHVPDSANHRRKVISDKQTRLAARSSAMRVTAGQTAPGGPCRDGVNESSTPSHSQATSTISSANSFPWCARPWPRLHNFRLVGADVVGRRHRFIGWPVGIAGGFAELQRVHVGRDARATRSEGGR